MKYKATQKLLDAIASSEFELTPLKETTYYQSIYECLVGIGKDFTMTIRVDADCIKENPDYFEEIK